EKVGSREHPNAAVSDRDARGDVQIVDEGANPRRTPVLVEAIEDLHRVATRALIRPRILDALGDPESPAVVEGHRERIDDVGLARDEIDEEAFGKRHALPRLLRRVGPVRHAVLAMRNDIVRCAERAHAEEDKERKTRCGAALARSATRNHWRDLLEFRGRGDRNREVGKGTDRGGKKRTAEDAGEKREIGKEKRETLLTTRTRLGAPASSPAENRRRAHRRGRRGRTGKSRERNPERSSVLAGRKPKKKRTAEDAGD